MGILKVHRQLSPLNSKSPLFLMVDGENWGSMAVFLQNRQAISPGRHSFHVRDILGFTSAPLHVCVQDDQDLELEVGGGNTIIIAIILLAIASSVLKTCFGFSQTMGATLAVVVAWVLSLTFLLEYWRHRVYFIRAKA